jgi:hypothetical protein
LEVKVSTELKQLLELAQKATMTDRDREEQRRSFAYGNTKIENNRITREMVNRQAELEGSIKRR